MRHAQLSGGILRLSPLSPLLAQIGLWSNRKKGKMPCIEPLTGICLSRKIELQILIEV